MKNVWKFIKEIFSSFYEKVSIPEKPPFTEVEYIPVENEAVSEVPNIRELPTPREQLYEIARDLLIPARDASPKDVAPDEVGCVETVDEVIKLLTGYYINGTKNKVSTSTIQAKKIFRESIYWEEVNDPEFGDIRLYVTGEGNGKVSNGHIFIEGKQWLMSNNSFSGKWEANYTVKTAQDYYEKKGGYKPYFFRLVKINR